MPIEKGSQKQKGSGRIKGTPNKVTKELRDMILGALDDVGGQKYLAMQAIENPGPFMALIGKVLPKDVKAEISGSIDQTVTVIELIGVKPFVKPGESPD